MNLGRLNHIGVATPSLDTSIAHWRDVMGATRIHDPFDLPAQGVRVCFVDTPNTQIELIEPLGAQAVQFRGMRHKVDIVERQIIHRGVVAHGRKAVLP